MSSIEIGLQEIFNALRANGIPVSEKAESGITILLVLLVIFPLVWNGGRLLVRLVTRVIKVLYRQFYSRDEKDFVEARNLLVHNLIYEVLRLNREADWNDFHYTALEAEVEVDPALDILGQDSNRVFGWLRTTWSSLKGMIVSPAGKPAKDLIRAIMRSRSRAFLIIGDPGSGKTVSLRHLFLRIAEKSANSKDKSATIPLYLNLKALNIPTDGVSAGTIRTWVIEQLQAGQDRTIRNFLENHFESILAHGHFFFIFDSFDEIPAVMDAYEEGEVVRQYAKALDDFLHAPHRCRGLVCSRPYRAPKVFVGQRITILSLSPKRVRRALERYLIPQRQLARRIWHELERERDDLLHVIRTPFYLALLARYVETEKRLPERHYELFEEFVATRAEADEERLAAFILTPDELLAKASRLAFAMTGTPNIGLEASLPQAQEILTGWGNEEVQLLMDALHYSKLGRISPKGPGEPQIFSFVHRRFQEYFAARHLRQHPDIAPFEELATDNRWREVLVLLCEVLPSDQLDKIISVSRTALAAGIEALSGTAEHRQAIEALRFLRDGFHSRLEDVPHDVRALATRFMSRQLESETLEDRLSSHLENSPDDVHTLIQIVRNYLASDTLRDSLVSDPPGNIGALIQRIGSQIASEDRGNIRLVMHLADSPNDIRGLSRLLKNQLKKGNFLDQKRAVEGIVLADEQSVPALLEVALNSGSEWVQETALRSCRVLPSPSEQIMRSIRKRLLRRYFRFELFRDFAFYRVLFSSPASFSPLLHYTWILGAFGFMQALAYMLFVLYCLVNRDLPILIVGAFLIWSGAQLAGRMVQLRPLVKEVDLGAWAGMLSIVSGVMLSLSKSTLPSAKDVHWIGAFFGLSVALLLNGFIAYLAIYYPTKPGDWVLLPFRGVIETGRKIAGFMRKLSLRSLAWILGAILLVAIVAFLMGEAFALLADCDYSLQCLYATHHFVLATLVAFVCVLIGLLFIGVLISEVWLAIWKIWISIRDLAILRLLSIRSGVRPASAAQAIERLHTFKSDWAKVQYIHALRNWLPISSEWNTLIEEADRQESTVRDELYQLVELWQESK